MINLKQAKAWLKDADAVIITAGNGVAITEGLDILSETNFDEKFSEIAKKYHVHTIGDALDRKFSSWTQQWLFWSELINIYTLKYQPSETMQSLRKLVAGKNYFIATSTFGHFFEKAGFTKERIFDAFGDWTLMQCSSGINHGFKSDLTVVNNFLQTAKDQVSDVLVPKCEICNSEMEIHIPLNANFFPDTDANTRLRWFLTKNETKKVVILELGVDETSPQLLDPMVKLVEQFANWKYIAADLTSDDFPPELQARVFALGENSQNLIAKLQK